MMRNRNLNKQFNKLFKPVFKRNGKGIYYLRYVDDHKLLSRYLEHDPRDVALIQNDNNREEINFPFVENPIENFNLNKKLAEFMIEVWRVNLSAIYPDIEVQLFSTDDLHEISELDSDDVIEYQLFPTIRLWRANTDNEFLQNYIKAKEEGLVVLHYDQTIKLIQWPEAIDLIQKYK